jgi:gamma-glutamyltranspeptidase/glutathione hydrolase
VALSAGRAGDRGQHTTHVSVIDRVGNAVAVTCTIEQVLGSGVVPRGAGFLLNNQLTDFDGPGTANEPKPNKRPRSSTSPTIVVRGGKPLMAVGGAGGSTIPMGVIQAIERVVDFREDIAHAVDAERVDARGSCGITGPLQLCVEQARLAPAVAEELRRRGHELIAVGEYAPMPTVQAAGTDLAAGERVAVTDPRNQPGDGHGAVGQS